MISGKSLRQLMHRRRALPFAFGIIVLLCPAAADGQAGGRPQYLWRKSFRPVGHLISFARDAHILASNESASTVTLRNSDTGVVLGIISVPSQIRRIRISDDGALLMADSWSQTSHNCLLFDVLTRTQVWSSNVLDSSSDMTRDGRYTIVGDRAGAVRVYETSGTS